MRGTVEWQTGELIKVIFVAGAKKEERVDKYHINYQCVASFETMKTYRSVWNNLGRWLKEHWGIGDFEQITSEHIEEYMLYKIEYYPSKQYLEKISSSLGKLETALHRFTFQKYGEAKVYDFQTRQIQLNLAKNLKQVYNGYQNRTYQDPKKIIDALNNPLHKIAASIQLSGAARSEGVTLIKASQLKGYRVDSITKNTIGVITTKEKGGKEGDVFIEMATYQALEQIIKNEGKFKISYKAYAQDILTTCQKLNITCHGSHGFRWTAAQRRVREYQSAGYSYEEALQGVSWEMKHYRASITSHYLGC